MTYRAAVAEPAASLVVSTRDGRVLVAQRAPSVPFLGGFAVFPGGRVDDADLTAARLFFPGDRLGAAKACALRELVEETGLLVARGRASPVPEALRDQPLPELAAALSVRPEAEDLEPAGRWITPEYSPIRFDTPFFLALVEDPLPPPTPSGELAWAAFLPAREVLRRWRDLELILPPPAKAILEVLQYGAGGAAPRLRAIPGARAEELLEFEPAPGIRQLPLRTPTLPPARHTNAYVIGDERLVIVDPATYEVEEREKLEEQVHFLTRAGAKVEAIVLTHHHVDHVGAADWLGQHFGAKTLAHPITRELLRGRVKVDGTLHEGDVLHLGRDAAGRTFDLGVLHTPGHAPGHLVLDDLRPGGRGLIVGDMVAAVGTIVVDPPEGNMAEYLRQLARLRALPEKVLYPAHGPPIVHGHAKLDQYLAHRRMREEKVLAALTARGPATPTELLDLAYDDTPRSLYPLAARACLAHLEKLVEDGRAAQTGGRFSAR